MGLNRDNVIGTMCLGECTRGYRSYYETGLQCDGVRSGTMCLEIHYNGALLCDAMGVGLTARFM